MAFPSQDRIKKALERLKDAEGTLMLPPNATTLEHFRWDLCQKFIKFKHQHHHSQIELADLLGVDAAKVSKILHHRIDEFSTDRLISLYEKLDPSLKLKVG